MIGPVSTTGRAMMASLQQAIDKGMPPDQAIQYVKSMAQQGVAPLTDLYSMMSQFERLKQKQVKPPQTPPTIKDQLNIMDQMQSQQPPAQPGNIQQMQAAPPAPSPMDRGLGAIDAGRMEYPQFNGGGIVAFQEGGPTGQFYGGFYPGMFDGPDRQQRMFGYSEPSPVQDYVSMGRELRKDPYLLKDLKEDPDSVPMTLPTITNPFSGLRAPEGGAYGGGGGGELPYGGPTSYGQNSLQNYLDQFYMDQMMQGGKQYAGGIYDMEGNKIGKAAGGVIGYADRGLVNAPIVDPVENMLLRQYVPDFDTLPPIQQNMIREQLAPQIASAKNAAAQGAAGPTETAVPKLPSLAEQRAEASARAERPVAGYEAEITAKAAAAGQGEAAKAMRARLEKRIGSLDEDEKKSRGLALMQIGAQIMEAASKPGATALGSIGAGLVKGIPLFDQLEQRKQDLRDRYEQRMLELQQAEELRKTGYAKEAATMQAQARADLRAIDRALAENELAMERLQYSEGEATKRAGIQAKAAEARAQARDKAVRTAVIDKTKKRLTALGSMDPGARDYQKAQMEITKAKKTGDKAAIDAAVAAANEILQREIQNELRDYEISSGAIDFASLGSDE